MDPYTDADSEYKETPLESNIPPPTFQSVPKPTFQRSRGGHRGGYEGQRYDRNNGDRSGYYGSGRRNDYSGGSRPPGNNHHGYQGEYTQNRRYNNINTNHNDRNGGGSYRGGSYGNRSGGHWGDNRAHSENKRDDRRSTGRSDSQY